MIGDKDSRTASPLTQAPSQRIAVLGWGSLLWDRRASFDSQIEIWHPDGPTLPLEFSRISRSRGGALTLVIDEQLGGNAICYYAFSKRSVLSEAVEDLRRREGTTSGNIGFLDRNRSDKRSRCAIGIDVIHSWSQTKGVDAVIWADLAPNFPYSDARLFTGLALEYLINLPPDVVLKAVEYIHRAPEQVKTGLRTFLKNQPWFEQKVESIFPSRV